MQENSIRQAARESILECQGNAALSLAEIEWLHNNGDGRSYAETARYFVYLPLAAMAP